MQHQELTNWQDVCSTARKIKTCRPEWKCSYYSLSIPGIDYCLQISVSLARKIVEHETITIVCSEDLSI